MIFELNQDNPQKYLLKRINDILLNDGVIIYPTDSNYSFGCSIFSSTALKRIKILKELSNKAPLTFIFSSLDTVQKYTAPIEKNYFHFLKKITPGPFTCIFKSSKLVPKIMLSKRETIGIRIPDFTICRELIEFHDAPILSSSIKIDGEDTYEFEEIKSKYEKLVDGIISVGDRTKLETTIIDMTSRDLVMLREGDAFDKYKTIFNF